MRYTSRHDGQERDAPTDELGYFAAPEAPAARTEAAALVARWPAKVLRRNAVAAIWCACGAALLRVYRTPHGHLAVPVGGRLDVDARDAADLTEDPAPFATAAPILLEEAFQATHAVVVACRQCGDRTPRRLDLRRLVVVLNTTADRDLRIDDTRLR